MSLCRVAQMDFQYGWGRYDDRGVELYDDNDLHDLIVFAADHLANGTTHEPLYHYDLAAFKQWCEIKLKQEQK